jgi:hypothetical protein
MDTIRYIIVVHGIGEQRKNETVLNVINRFAEIRAKTSPKETYEILTLGKATGQTGKDYYLESCRYELPESNFIPWMEFKQIPQDPKKTPITGPFYGEKSDTGENLRFVDLCWSDIMQQDYPHVGQKVDDWAKGLVGRLKRKDEYEKNNNLDRNPSWVLKIMERLAETLVFARCLLSVRVKKVEDMIYHKFLGDVQLYGEYPRTRGRAVRRFHRLMNLIEKEHNKKHPNIKPKYTILAHSLGTVMSMDALVSAHADKLTRSGIRHWIPNYSFTGYLNDLPSDIQKLDTLLKKDEKDLTPAEKKDLQNFRSSLIFLDNNKIYQSLPFPGYAQDTQDTMEDKIKSLDVLLKKDEKILNKDQRQDIKDLSFLNTVWIDNVDSFITLGSPIDKYLVLWWLNYQYLNDSYWASVMGAKKNKIKHFNYTDEQDPVGHALDKFQATIAFKNIFEKSEDRVFNRYNYPGVAHVNYWDDLDLFQHIEQKVIEGKEQPPRKSFWCKIWLNIKVVFTGDKPGLINEEPDWFKLSTYRKALCFTYFLVPFILTILISLTFAWALITDDVHGKLLAFVVVIVFFMLGRRLIYLMLWWRRVLRDKAHKYFVDRKAELEKEKKNKKDQDPKELTERIKQIELELKEYPVRTRARRIAIGLIILSPLIFGALTIIFYLLNGPFPDFLYKIFSPNLNFFYGTFSPYQAALKINILLFLMTGTLVFGYVAYRYKKIKS